MTAYRTCTLLVGALCLTGTAVAQTNYLQESDPYGVRLTRLDDQLMRTPILGDGSGSARNVYRPAMQGPTSVRTPETVGTPSPVPQASSQGAPSDNYQDALAKTGWGDDCGGCLPTCCCNTHWYGYIGGLTMGRDMPNKFWTTFDQTNPANQLLYFPGADWGGGVDTRIGYWFGCGCCDQCDPCNGSCGPSGRFGIEAVYWGMWGLDGTASVTSATNQLGTVLDNGLVGFLAPNDATDWFDGSPRVQLSRNDEFHNVEINFLWLPCCNPCNRFQMTALAGVRFFRFSEGLTWNQFANPANIPVNAPDEAILNADVQNNLIGFQLGAYLNYQICRQWSVFAIPKIGIYGNHISAHNSLALSDGTFASFDANGDLLNFNTSKNVCSMLGSIDVGFNWAFNCHWSVIGGYRAVIATDLALGDNQIPQFFADEAGWRTVKTNGDLLLHGGFAGIEARF